MTVLGSVRLRPSEMRNGGFVSVFDWDETCPLCGEPMAKARKGGTYECVNSRCQLIDLKHGRSRLFAWRLRSEAGQ